jgi:N-dimethylarginine dimethylaminohydrolase
MYPNSILMVPPTHFRVDYVINPYMQDEQGDLQVVEPQLAMKQWQQLKRTYEDLGLTVYELAQRADLPDMVFCANTFVSLKKGNEIIYVLSEMANPQRRSEVEHTKKYLEQFQNKIIPAPCRFEGTGDAIINYETGEIFLGIGPRTDEKMVNFLEDFD